MNIEKILNILQIIKNYQEIISTYRLEKCQKIYNNNINDNNPKHKEIIIYKSKLISKVELSLELIYDIIFSEKKVFEKNIFINLIFELIKLGYRFKEYKLLKNIGIPFYVEENIFYSNFLGIDKNQYINNIINNNNFDKNNMIYPYEGNLFLPINTKIIIINNKKYKNKFFDELNKDDYNIKSNYIGEILYLIRPAIYISLLMIFKNNKIIPLIINIIIDIVIFLTRMDINKNNYKKYKINFLIQKIYFLEIKQRTKNFFIYLLREPIYTNITIPLIKNILPI